jgi:hypothetical protein
LLLHLQSPPLPWVVTALDIVKDIRSGFASCPVVLAIHAFAFKNSEEALGGDVVSAAAHRTHAADHLVRG